MAKANDKKETEELKSELINLYVQTYESCCPHHDAVEDICFGIARRDKIQTCSTRKCPFREEFRKRLENMDIAEFVKAKKTTQI